MDEETKKLIDKLKKEADEYEKSLREGYNGILADLKQLAADVTKWQKVTYGLQEEATEKERAEAAAESRPVDPNVKPYFAEPPKIESWYRFGKAVGQMHVRVKIIRELNDFIESEKAFVKSIEKINKDKKNKQLKEQLAASKKGLITCPEPWDSM